MEKLWPYGKTIVYSRDVAQSFYRCMKVPSFILDHVLTDLGENWAVEAQKVPWADSTPPPGLWTDQKARTD